MKTLNDVHLKDLLPESIAKDGNVAACAEAIDPKLKLITEATDTPSIYVSIDNLSSIALDHLAKQYDVSVWRDSWNVELKRSVLKTAISDKRNKGTLGAVKEALKSLGAAAIVEEWWQTTPKGTPHTFTIYVTQQEFEGVIPSEMQEDVISMIDDAKPLRSHYRFVVVQNANGSFGACGFIRALAFTGMIDKGDSKVLEGGVGIVAAARTITHKHLILTA